MKSKNPPSTVRSVMTRPVITVEQGSSVYEAAQLMNEKCVGSVVVTLEEKPVGIITERDMVKRVVAKGVDASKVKAKRIMTKPLTAIKGDSSIIEAIRLMQRKKIRRLVVVENGKLIGIVTQRDLLRALAFHVIVSFRPLLEAR